MAGGLVGRAAREFGVVIEGSWSLPEARSAASVRAVRTVGGAGGYLKVTPAALGAEPLAAARREFRFYEELAATIPVCTPRILNGLSDETGVALLFAAAGESRSPRLWTERNWRQLGGELAALHSMSLPSEPYWIRIDGTRRAVADPDLERVEAFWGDRLPRLADVVADLGGLREAMTVLPPVFTHGDCHTGNLLHSAGSLVFCDWQSAGIARPESDLAFLNVRAVPSAATVPPELIDAYLAGRPCDRQVLQRAVLAEELASYLFLWPPYAALNDPAGIARVTRRTGALTELWLAS